MDDRDKGNRVAGTLLMQLNVAGWLGIFGAVVAAFQRPPVWIVVCFLFLGAVIAFGIAAHCVFRD